MSSRDKILAAVKANQPAITALPDLYLLKGDYEYLQAKFTQVLTGIGAKVLPISSYDEVINYIRATTLDSQRVMSTIPELWSDTESVRDALLEPHTLEDLELTIISAHFGVAENGAVWITEELIGYRVLPFITQHLAVVLNLADLMPTMHEAYQRIGAENYGFGTFIAGPSKTADIEQSLVLGAHGPRTMTVFLLER